jgi:hypothetical protein
MSAADEDPRGTLAAPADEASAGAEPATAGRWSRPHGTREWLLAGLRYALPTVVTFGGLGIMALGGENNLEGGAGVVSAGLAIYFVNWLFRIGVEGDLEREREDAAREYFDRHGRWPS